MAFLELQDLHRDFGTNKALDGIEIALGEGEFLSLLGPSGCGKTTALRLVAGFDRPDQGRIVVDGKDVTRVAPNKRDMGMVFQAYSLFPNMTAHQNVEFGLKIRGKDRTDRRKRVDDLLELVGLGHAGTRYPHQLSGGMQQRVALARALAIEPRVLLLDEPLSALDAKVRVQLREEIRRIQLELGITTLYVTHDQEEALSVSDHVAVMYRGRIEQMGSPAEMYTRAGDAVRGRVHRHDEPPRGDGRRPGDRRGRDGRRHAHGRGGTRQAARRARARTHPAGDGGRDGGERRRREHAHGRGAHAHVPRAGHALAHRRGGGEPHRRHADRARGGAAPRFEGGCGASGDRGAAARPYGRAAANSGRARSGRSVKSPPTPRSARESMRAGSFTV